MHKVLESKVTASHLARNAYLYIRQSTIHQVFENTESLDRQYALRQKGCALGWKPEQINVIDCDLGRSGSSSEGREGFQQLVTEVGMGRAGIVMGLEVSRLARNSTDWHRLLEMCALSETLILDEDGIYNPSHFNDRLLLGMKGTMSEAEIHMLKARLQGGLLNKARRGELMTRLPIGFVYDEQGRVILDPDAQVQNCIREVFQTFRRTGTAAAVAREFHEREIRFPMRPVYGPKKGELIWQELSYPRARQVIRNVRYAGVFSFGKTRTRRLGNGRRSTRRLPMEEWAVLIKEAHEGYISWDEYVENQRRLKENMAGLLPKGNTGPPREGPALLQGLILCGICGRRMNIAYHVRKGCKVPDYVCGGERMPGGRTYCQSVTGSVIDEAVGHLIIETMTPVALEVALEVQQELEARQDQADLLRREQVERARFEADAARRRFMRVDPDNRLVADTLEAEWNEKLRALNNAKDEYERQCRKDGALLDASKKEKIRELATDFPKIWTAVSTSNRDRKRMIRLLIEDVTLVKDQRITIQVRFRGGKTATLNLPPVPPSWKLRQTSSEVVTEIDRLLDRHTNSEVAEILNRKGFRSGEGLAFNPRIIKNIQRQYGLKNLKARMRKEGLLTVQEIANHYGVRPATISRWRRGGLLKAHRCNDKEEYLFTLPAEGELLPIPSRHTRILNAKHRQEIKEV